MFSIVVQPEVSRDEMSDAKNEAELHMYTSRRTITEHQCEKHGPYTKPSLTATEDRKLHT